MDSWAPRWMAWERDNVGLQIGDPGRPLRRVLVTLDVTPETVLEAIRRRIDLVVSHHPLLFRPLLSLTPTDPVARMALDLAEHRIALFAAHTNLDAARDGVSMTLARQLGLENVHFLSPLRDVQAKIVVFVPASHVGEVRKAMSDAGAGIIGEYSECAFVVKGSGSFRGSSAANPFVGAPERLESVEETRIEMVAPRARVDAVVRAMKSVHPYEEVAYDVYDVRTPNANGGMGAVGDLPRPLMLPAFTRRVKRVLGARALRIGGRDRGAVKRVAVCGGSGSELLGDAVREGSDVFVTADVRYHAFQNLPSDFTLIDAGHWETESVVLPVIAGVLRAGAKSRHEAISVFLSEHTKNPVRVA